MLVASTVPLPPLGEHELLVFWCQLLVLLTAARVGGYVLRLAGQPRVIGELVAGVVLGPSVFGELWPRGWTWLFPDDDRQAGLLLGLAWFGIVLLLMTTGAETDLSAVRRHGRAMVTTAVGSLVVPFGAGIALGWWLPVGFIGDQGSRGTFAVFIGIALAISSLPVAARILGDLGLLHRPLGQLVLTVAMTNDVVGWILLGILAGVAERGSVSTGELSIVIAGTVAIAADPSPWLLAFSIFFFLSLALVKRYVELDTSTNDEKERLSGRGYRPEDKDIVSQAGVASGFASVVVLSLYLESDLVHGLYRFPWALWILCPLVLYIITRIWILARRGEFYDDPVVFIAMDWRSQAMVVLGALVVFGAGPFAYAFSL